MPKKTLNINDFSGGIVTNKNPRDTQNNESQGSDGVLSQSPGELSLVGGFVQPLGFQNNEGGYQKESLSEGIINTWAVQPEYAFRRFLVVKWISSAGGHTTVESQGLEGGYHQAIRHGLTTGCRVAMIKHSDYSSEGGSLITGIVTRISSTQFSIPDLVGLTSTGFALLATESTYDSDAAVNSNIALDIAISDTSPANNVYILKTYNYGIFGFYNIGTSSSSFFGDINRNLWGGIGHEDPWLFDIQWLWDWNQKGGATDISFGRTPVMDAFYDNGHFRALVKPDKKWEYSFCRRPVSLIHINPRINFFLNEEESGPLIIDTHSNRIKEGWYPLRSHILSPVEYKTDNTSISTYDHTFGMSQRSMTLHPGLLPDNIDYPAYCGVLRSKEDQSTTGDFNAVFEGSSASLPKRIHRFVVQVANGSEENKKEGDWMFKTGVHKKISLGVSYIYDDIEFTRQVESTINPLQSVYWGGDSDYWENQGNYNNEFTSFDDTLSFDNVGLNLSLTLYVGDFNSYAVDVPALQDVGLFPVETGFNISAGESRGSTFKEGFSNWSCYNPRIVGVNVWFTGDDSGSFDDPYWLATFGFNQNKKAVSHDGIEGDKWSIAGDDDEPAPCVIQSITGITKIPNITYKIKNGYSHETVTQAWYTTSAVINRRLYAGNVSYFDFPISKIKTQLPDTLITNKPDRILVSPVNKFDILPITNFLDVVTEDGQDIVKLTGFGQKLLVFKHNDLFVVDCSGEFEFLENTFKSYGTWNAAMVTQTADYIFWANTRGIYAYSKDGQVLDIIKDTIGLEKWQKHFSSSTHLSYEPENNYLIAHCKAESESLKDRRILIINIQTGSVFYKSSPSDNVAPYYSSGLNVNNRLYITSGDGQNTQERYRIIPDTDYVPNETSLGNASFKLPAGDSAPGKNRLSSNIDHLLIRKGSAWILANSGATFSSTGAYAQTETKAAEWTVRDMNNCMSQNSDYDIKVDYNPDTEFFSLNVRAKSSGVSYNGNAVDLSAGTGALFGSSARVAFSSTNDTAGTDINDGNISDWTFDGLDNGTDQIAGIWYIMPLIDAGASDGISYVLNVYIKKGNQDSTSDHVILTSTYVTGEYDYYKSGRSGDYTYSDETGGTEAQNTENITKNIREFLISNPMKNQYGDDVFLDDFFIIGAIAGSGIATYFTLTTRTDNDVVANAAEINIEGECYNNSGGNLLAWSNTTTAISSPMKWISKDFDFGEPNVRKKVYKGYITYKGNVSYTKIYYKADQGASWTQATITGESTDQLPSSSDFTRKEFKFGTGGNNVYSFAIKLESSGFINDIVINDLTLIYRTKSVK